MESLSQNIQLDLEAACSTLLPERSKALYDKEYENFMKWKEENSLQSNTEEIFLAYFVQKLVAVVAIAGGCRCDELLKMSITDIEDKGDLLLIHVPYTKNHKKRSFTILSTGFGINPINLYRKYINLRPGKVNTMRLFLCYRSGKCTVQPIGINSFGKMPQLIAKFLNLKNSEMYTGHAFRRSAATLLSDCGADLRTLKRFGGWKSDAVVEGYIEDSLQNKVGIAKKILGDGSSTSSSINHDIAFIEQKKEVAFTAY